MTIDKIVLPMGLVKYSSPAPTNLNNDIPDCCSFYIASVFKEFPGTLRKSIQLKTTYWKVICFILVSEKSGFS